MTKNILFLFIALILGHATSAQDVILKKDRYYNRQTGKLYTGVFKEYDSETAALISETTIRDGYLDGVTTLYFSSGKVMEIRTYLSGKKHGTWMTYNEAGIKTAEAAFSEGKKDGHWYIWDDNGVLRYDMFYVNGEKKGTWLIMDENGKEVSREVF
jgi:antitoxin component YwqK of YwqJK toxin-antitoxin module